MTNQTDYDVVEHMSAVAFAPTLERLLDAIRRTGMTLFAQIDHAGGARDAGLAMPPTMLLIYGNPKGGTPVMQAAPLTALDLPLRVLLRETADGRVLIAFHPIAAMLQRSGVPQQLATRLEPAQRVLVEAIQS